MLASTPFYRVRWTLRARSPWSLHSHQHAILYALLCEAARGAAGDGAPHMPEGLLLDAPEQCRDRVAPGETFAFGATLVEADPLRAARRLQVLAGGLERIGRDRPRRPVALGGNFDLIDVQDLIACRSLRPGEPFLSLPLDTVTAECGRLADAPRLTLRFLSPLRLELPQGEAVEGHRFADGSVLNLGQLVRTIQKRLAALGMRRADGADELPFTDEAVRLVENRLVWLDLEYGPRDARKTLGGAMGRLVLEADGPDLRAALVWGQYARLGRNLHFGFGRYRIEELGDDPTACRREAGLLGLCLHDEALAQAAAASSADPHAVRQAAEDLVAGRYVPGPGQTLHLTDGQGRQRLLRVPSRIDRAVQRALLARLGPAVERLFETSSFAWRRGLGRDSAARRLQTLFRDGWRFAVSADFDRFFDSIPRRLLHDRLEAWLGDDGAAAAVRLFVEAGGTAEAGIPTGAPLSPLLGNMLLDRFDEVVEVAGGRLVRYADDFLILSRTREEAERLHRLAAGLAEGLLLHLNDGSGVLDLAEPFDFLGYRFGGEERWRHDGPTGPRAVQDLGWRDADRSDALPALLLPGEQADASGPGTVVVGPGAALVDVVGDELRVSRGAGGGDLAAPLAGLERVFVLGAGGLDARRSGQAAAGGRAGAVRLGRRLAAGRVAAGSERRRGRPAGAVRRGARSGPLPGHRPRAGAGQGAQLRRPAGRAGRPGPRRRPAARTGRRRGGSRRPGRPARPGGSGRRPVVSASAGASGAGLLVPAARGSRGRRRGERAAQHRPHADAPARGGGVPGRRAVAGPGLPAPGRRALCGPGRRPAGAVPPRGRAGCGAGDARAEAVALRAAGRRAARPGPGPPGRHAVPRPASARPAAGRGGSGPGRASSLAGADAGDGPRPAPPPPRSIDPLRGVRTPMSRYVAAYDISRNSRRSQVADILREYGRRVQWSVFEIDVDAEELAELRFRVGVLLARSDRFDLFPIDVRFPRRRLSWQRSPIPDDPVKVI